MQIVSIINQKGGVGKTTTAVTLAHLLSNESYRVVIVDLDGQGHVAESFGLDAWPGLYEFVVREAGLMAGRPSGRFGLYLIASDHTAVEVRQHLTSRPFGEAILARQIREQLARHFDVAFLDVAPGIDVLQVSALTASTQYLIPVALDHLAIAGASRALHSAATLLEVGGLDARFLGILPTFWERTTNETIVQLQRLVDAYGAGLIWEPIPRDTKVREASAYGQTVLEYAPGCRALCGVEIENDVVGGYRRAAARLLKELEL